MTQQVEQSQFLVPDGQGTSVGRGGVGLGREHDLPPLLGRMDEAVPELHQPLGASQLPFFFANRAKAWNLDGMVG